MFKFLSIGLVVATVLVACTDNAVARGRRYRRYYSYRPAPAAKTTTTPAAGSATSTQANQPSTQANQPSTQANRQSVRRYSYAPSGNSNRSYRSSPSYGSTSRPRMSGPYGPQMWRADRKVLGY